MHILFIDGRIERILFFFSVISFLMNALIFFFSFKSTGSENVEANDYMLVDADPQLSKVYSITRFDIFSRL